MSGCIMLHLWQHCDISLRVPNYIIICFIFGYATPVIGEPGIHVPWNHDDLAGGLPFPNSKLFLMAPCLSINITQHHSISLSLLSFSPYCCFPFKSSFYACEIQHWLLNSPIQTTSQKKKHIFVVSIPVFAPQKSHFLIPKSTASPGHPPTSPRADAAPGVRCPVGPPW